MPTRQQQRVLWVIAGYLLIGLFTAVTYTYQCYTMKGWPMIGSPAWQVEILARIFLWLPFTLAIMVGV